MSRSGKLVSDAAPVDDVDEGLLDSQTVLKQCRIAPYNLAMREGQSEKVLKMLVLIYLSFNTKHHQISLSFYYLTLLHPPEALKCMQSAHKKLVVVVVVVV